MPRSIKFISASVTISAVILLLSLFAFSSVPKPSNYGGGDSISPQGVRLTTFELEYPRFIHAEMMTHRVFSRNALS